MAGEKQSPRRDHFDELPISEEARAKARRLYLGPDDYWKKPVTGKAAEPE
jgi:hypothetical protein